MKILMVGSSGLIGTALASFLTDQGHEIIKMVRPNRTSNHQLMWDPYNRTVEIERLEGFDAVINLAGENIADTRWSEKRKQQLLQSRVNVTQFLCETLAKLSRPPKLLLNASAIGFYGDQGNSILNEDGEKGTGFLADLCQKWEAATSPAEQVGIRVIKMRTGVVLTAKGGAFAKMVPLFKFGLGGTLGNGKQYMSWIAIEDLVNAVQFLLQNDTVDGPVNMVTPNPITNQEFTKTLGKLLNRPTFFSVPRTIVTAVFGEMGEEVFLSSTRVIPEKLVNAGFEFHFPRIEQELKQVIGK